ncbi:MAG: (d)CMP kinase [Tunicatimonas sp.]
MPNDITVAIDGYSGVGKSSTAKAVAQQLGYTYVDSGAMYRAVTLHFLRNDVELTDATAVAQALANLQIGFQPHPRGAGYETLLNGENVEQEIRGMRVSNHVSPVSALPVVRKKMVAVQQQLGEGRRVVMDGRDIGTKVFPQAELKVFMTADPTVRAQRRQAELREKGQTVAVSDIERNLLQRDELDSSREESPLVKANDAVTLDTTHLTFEAQVAQVVDWARSIINSSNE